MRLRPALLVFTALAACGGPPTGSSPAPSSPVGTPIAPGPARTDSAVRFEERGLKAGLQHRSVSGSAETRYILEANGQGLCALDFDRDGDEDLYVVNGQRLDDATGARSALYRNRGDGNFDDATTDSGTGSDGWGFGCAVADWDQDGWPDLFVATWRQDRFYRNRGDGSFEDVTAAIAPPEDYWGESAAFADYDKDGFPDLYVANNVRFDDQNRMEPSPEPSYLGIGGVFKGPLGLKPEPHVLYRNRGDGTFEDVSERSLINKVKPSYGLAVLFSDLNGDGWPDIFVANDSMPNFLFRNLGDGTFAERGLADGVAVNGDGKAQASMGIAFGDVDGNRWDDLFVTNFSDDTNTMYMNLAGSFSDETWASGLGKPSWSRLAWGTVFLDADNDGALDLFVGNGHVYPQLRGSQTSTEYEQEDQFFRGDGRGHFELRVAGDLGASKHLTRGAITADFDGDGRLDIATVRLHETPALFHNTSKTGAWMEPLLEGRDCNRDALGAVATLRNGDNNTRRTVFSGGSYASQSSLRLHFGSRAVATGATLEVLWPCGRSERFPAAAGSRATLVEGTGSPLP